MTLLSMDGVNLVLSIIGGTVGLIIVGAGAYAIFTTTRKDRAERRLSAWNDDLTRRVDYLEPQLQKLQAQNRLLMELHNPTALLEAMDTSAQERHSEIVGLLREQTAILRSLGDIKG